MVYEDNYKPLGTAGASKFVSLDLVWVARRVQLSVIISMSVVQVFCIQVTTDVVLHVSLYISVKLFKFWCFLFVIPRGVGTMKRKPRAGEGLRWAPTKANSDQCLMEIKNERDA